MNRLVAAAELTWFYNVAYPQMGVSAIDYGAVTVSRSGWQYQDPNIETASRARPIWQALRRCDSRAQIVLYLRFSCRSGPLEKDHQGKLIQRGPDEVHSDLAALVRHLQPQGSRAQQEMWARAAVTAALAQFCGAFDEV